MKILVVVDMQNDFIDGALGTKEAAAIVPKVVERINSFDGSFAATHDTHTSEYLETQEGRNLPVSHCIRGTEGWEIVEQLREYTEGTRPIDKPTFGSVDMCSALQIVNQQMPIEKITLIGLCTDICVISNAMMIKAFLPEVEISVDARCCAGVTPESHLNALAAMKMCQIQIENE